MYSVAVGGEMLRRPSGGLPAMSSCQVQGPGSRVQGLLGQAALEDEQDNEGTSANTGLGIVTLVAI